MCIRDRFIAYLALLVYFLIFSESLGRDASQRDYAYNLELFKEIRRFYIYRKQLGMEAFLLNVFGNVIEMCIRDRCEGRAFCSRLSAGNHSQGGAEAAFLRIQKVVAGILPGVCRIGKADRVVAAAFQGQVFCLCSLAVCKKKLFLKSGKIRV